MEDVAAQRLESPQGTVPRLRNGTFDDSRKIFDATVQAIQDVTRCLHFSDNIWGKREKVIHSQNGGELKYSRDSGGTTSVIFQMPTPYGEEKYELESRYDLLHVDADSETPNVHIQRTMVTGGRAHVEESWVYGSPSAHERHGQQTSFRTENLRGVDRHIVPPAKHPSVIDPDFILKRIQEEFPQVGK